MKHKGLIIATTVFLLLINTSYFWEGKLRLFAFPAFLLLLIFYGILVIVLFRQIVLLFNEKFGDKKRLAISAILFVVLLMTSFMPGGFIDFDRLSGNDLLIAEREGGGNCTIILKLKDNNTFRERSVCFGVTEFKGHYEVKGDTIIFKDVDNGRQNEYYSYALIKPAAFQNINIIGELIRYKDKSDTTGHELFITKNNLNLLLEQKPNR